MNNRNNPTMALFVVIGLGALVYLLWAGIINKVERRSGGAVCTTDALQCPDGSYVGRSGPDCQFVCPIGTSTKPTSKEVSLQASVGEDVSGLNVRITPTKIVEDSRCPIGVQCIQAGTVRVQALILSGLGTSTPIFTLDKPITTEVEIITLVAVSPVKEAGKNISTKDYRFTFKVTKR